MIVVSLLLILVAVTLLVLGLTGGSSALLISSIVTSLLAAVFLVVGARQTAAGRRTTAAASDGVPADRDHDPYLAAAAGADLEDEPGGGPRRRYDQRAMASAPGDYRRPGSADDDDASGADFSAPSRADVSSNFSRSDGISNEERAPGAGAPAPAGGSDAEDAASRSDAAADRRAAPAAGDADEFGEPDADDPADEPLPQAVRPGDAVRMSRIDAEVLVVDGRPRYHLADCPHLVGRLSEPLPAREAVELGFSPCGLCRPVNRLIAQATHR